MIKSNRHDCQMGIKVRRVSTFDHWSSHWSSLQFTAVMRIHANTGGLTLHFHLSYYVFCFLLLRCCLSIKKIASHLENPHFIPLPFIQTSKQGQQNPAPSGWAAIRLNSVGFYFVGNSPLCPRGHGCVRAAWLRSAADDWDELEPGCCWETVDARRKRDVRALLRRVHKRPSRIKQNRPESFAHFCVNHFLCLSRWQHSSVCLIAAAILSSVFIFIIWNVNKRALSLPHQRSL